MNELSTADDECVELVSYFSSPSCGGFPQRFDNCAAVGRQRMLPTEGRQLTKLDVRKSRRELLLCHPRVHQVAKARGVGEAE